MATWRLYNPWTQDGVPRTDLTPTVQVTRIDTQVVVLAETPMVSVGDGSYYYDWVGYDPDVGYSARFDAGTDDVDTRLAWAPNIIDVPVSTRADQTTADLIRKINSNRQYIDKTTFTLTIYDDDEVTPILVFDLKNADGNPAFANIFERIPVS